MSAQETKAVKAPAAKQASTMPEFLRKFVVGLKRSPQTIPLVVLVIAFLVYSMNLTHISDTTAKIQGPGMGCRALPRGRLPGISVYAIISYKAVNN